jgi:hypothetical protein
MKLTKEILSGFEKTALQWNDVPKGAKKAFGFVYKHPVATAGGIGALLASILVANNIAGLSNLYYNYNQLSAERKQNKNLENIASLIKSTQQSTPVAERQQIIVPRLS